MLQIRDLIARGAKGEHERQRALSLPQDYQDLDDWNGTGPCRSASTQPNIAPFVLRTHTLDRVGVGEKKTYTLVKKRQLKHNTAKP
jgi:hypothetical protein